MLKRESCPDRTQMNGCRSDKTKRQAVFLTGIEAVTIGFSNHEEAGGREQEASSRDRGSTATSISNDPFYPLPNRD
jgi:hypothetical protein